MTKRDRELLDWVARGLALQMLVLEGFTVKKDAARDVRKGIEKLLGIG